MTKPRVNLIAAISENRALGKNNKLLFLIPEDLKRFKRLTGDHPIIMGRKTFESIGQPLPDRTNIIVSRDKSYKAAGCVVVHSLEEGLEAAERVENEEIFVIGGGQIYEQALPLADKLYLTIVEGEYEADTFFPDYSQFKKAVFEEEHKTPYYKYKFVDLEK